MRLSLVIHVTGLVVRVFGLMFLAPLAVALLYGEYVDAVGFAVVTGFTCAVGHLMRQAGGLAAEDAVEGMRRVEGLAIVSIAWLVIAWFAAHSVHVERPRSDRRDVRVDVGSDHDRRDSVPRFLGLRPRHLLLARHDATGSAAWA